MHALRRQVESIDPADWVSVADAATLTGLSERAWQLRANGECEQARRQGRTALAAMMPGISGGKPVWHLHRSLDARLSRFPGRDQRAERARAALYAEHPHHVVDLAYRRAHWLREWRSACDGRRDPGVTESDLAERIVTQARALDGADFRIRFRTLQLWRRAYQAIGPDGQVRGVAALIDQRGCAAAGGGRHEPRSPEAVDYFYGLYHAQSRPKIKLCHDCTIREAVSHGWHWPKSYPATQKWLDAYDCKALTCLMRDGRDAWQHRYMAHNRTDYNLIAPGDLYVTDHTQCDFWIEHKGEQLRPWLTAILDAKTRCIVGWHLGTAAHQDSILAAMTRAFWDWAIPRVMRIDNGKDFASKLLTGVTKATRRRRQSECKYGPAAERRDAALVTCAAPGFSGIIHELGIDLIYAIPYAPWSKGQLEHWFGTFENNVGRTFVTYCGNSPENRPEVLESIRRGYTREQRRAMKKRYGRGWSQVARMKFIDQAAVPTLQEAREAVADWIEVYHATAHRGQGMNRQSPRAAWNAGGALRKADPQALLFLMRSRGLYKVTGNGVSFTVGNSTLHYGAAAHQLDPYRGREVFITVDGGDLSRCFAFTADRKRFIAELASADGISPLATVDDLREASAAVARRRKRFIRANREAPQRMRNVSQELRAKARERAAELRATGTDNVRPVNLEPVRTGFEGVSTPVRRAVEIEPVTFAYGDLADLVSDDADDESAVVPRSGIMDLLPDDCGEREVPYRLEGLL